MIADPKYVFAKYGYSLLLASVINLESWKCKGF